GSTVNYTIHVDGPASGVSVHGLHITDVVPAPLTGVTFVSSTFAPADGCNVVGNTLDCPTLSSQVGSGNTITFTANIPLSAAGTNNICNQSQGVTGVANSNVDCFNVAPASVTVSKSVDAPGSFQSGDPISWTINVTSNGPSPAAGVAINDTATDGWTITGQSV